MDGNGMARRLIAGLAGVGVLAGLMSAPPAIADPAPGGTTAHDSTAAGIDRAWRGLAPGEQVTYAEQIPVDLVFLGYPELDHDEVAAELPQSYEPQVRAPLFYGVDGRPMGLRYDFSYRFLDADRALEDRFFAFLADQGEPRPATAPQQEYNAQESNLLDVSDEVLEIDAPSVEQWLDTHARKALGIGPNRYTVFYVNWYERDDFAFHVYGKTDEPDPDTGHNFGDRDSRKLLAWGGTDGRSWFFDPSAGPDSWSGNANVDDEDIDGDGVPDYRIPPIWEYDADGYRDPAALAGDLGKVTRFVAINLLFTTSPLYDPMLATPGSGGAKVAHLQVLQGDPGSDGTDYLDADLVEAKLRALQPYHTWLVGTGVTDPIDDEAQRSLEIWAGVRDEPGCWEPYGSPFAELFCYFEQNREQYIPEYGPADYVTPTLLFNTSTELSGGLLGYADDNWVDGTQTQVFAFDTPEYREAGYGFTTTSIHEVGHHIGLSHPHDGLDPELGLDYGGSGDTYFAWLGDQSNTMMSYIDLNWDFGRFDKDNIARWEFAGYLNRSNALLGDILEHPDASRVRALLVRADTRATAAQRSFERWRYDRAVAEAIQVHDLLVTAAERLGIDPAPEVFTLDGLEPNPDVPRQVDPIRDR